ncbi:hamartin-like isoform X2 [Sphaeramia orbicularis]|uniref:hamartin-like isoform X2 n=1 Tax=Sphaeramia orbicularis TaxID=375764 RepID=UPI001180EC1F|nr:hamartin-like isoform X2 [Sphaeramia orbicularis]
MMSKEQVSISELLLSLDSLELQEAEQVRASVNQQLSSDRGGAVLSSLVEYYLDSSSSQAVLLLSSIRESHHKLLLEKLNEILGRPGTRLAALTLLGHLIRKQPPWVHHVSRSALLPSLLRCLKTDADVVVLITGVLVLITLLPMIPQAGKQHIYDFFDVFGRLASWSLKNPGHVPVVHLVHLQASVYSLFHRLYGMFPCNFISYLRLHYSMKENLDTFQEVVKPMLEHVRVHPELVTGTQDYELDPSRWRCYEVHDIVIECSRLSLDPLESSCEDDLPSSSSSAHRHHDTSFAPPTETPSGGRGFKASGSLSPPPLTHITSDIQVDDVTWSPSSQCGLSTPPPEPAATGTAHSLSRTASISGVKCPSSATVTIPPPTEHSHQPTDGGQVRRGQVKQHPITELEEASFQPIRESEGRTQSDVITRNEEVRSDEKPRLLTSTPCRDEEGSITLFFTPPHSSSTNHRPELSVLAHLDHSPAPSDQSPAPPYEPLFELALPRAATLFVGKKTQEALHRRSGEQQEGGGASEGADQEEDHAPVSPLEVLDQLIVHGHDAHQRLSRRLSVVNKSLDRSHFGGKQQSMKIKGPAQGEELQALRSQLLLVHSQLQYERFKRQQHAIRNRRLLRRVINATALEEQSVAMRAQLGVQEAEIRALKESLKEEQRRYTELHEDTQTHSKQLNAHIQQLLLQQQDVQRDNQRLQSELQECQSRLRDLEAELQKANNKSYNAEHQLTQLSLKLCSSEQLQQQIYMMNQQLLLLRETNRALRETLEAGDGSIDTEVSMLQCSVGREYQRLKDSDVQQRQMLEAANHRIAELEGQLTKKDQLILDQKKLLEDTKAHSRALLSASEGRCVALRAITQSLQVEMLHLYSQIHLGPQDPDPGESSRPNSGDDILPPPQGGPRPRPSPSVSILNGGVEPLSTSPLLLPSYSSSPLTRSPIESPLAVGSFLEQRARQLFRPTNQNSQDEEADPQQQKDKEEEEKEEEEEEREVEETQTGSPPLGQEVEEETLLAGSPQMEPPSWAPPLAPATGSTPSADLTLAVRQRRHELSIMDYDETLPEF